MSTRARWSEVLHPRDGFGRFAVSASGLHAGAQRDLSEFGPIAPHPKFEGHFFVDTQADHSTIAAIAERHGFQTGDVRGRFPELPPGIYVYPKAHARGLVERELTDPASGSSPYTLGELEGMHAYREDSGGINNALRRPSSQELASFQPLIESVDDAMHRAPLAEGRTLYRWMSGADARRMLRGQQYRDRGFLSTSGDPNASSSFGDHRVEIEVPAGTPSIHMNSAGLPGDPLYDVNDEYLLPRDAVLKVEEIAPGRLRARLVGFAV
jgi:hypothetical protein